MKTGAVLWQTRLGTSVQGFPVSFSIGGKQYIAVTTGLGGGSPRDVPRVIAPDIHHPRERQRVVCVRAAGEEVGSSLDFDGRYCLGKWILPVTGAKAGRA